MSPAEQKRKKREEKKQRDLIAQLMVIYRRMQPSPYSDSSKPDEAAATIEKAAQNIREQRHRFLEELEDRQVGDLEKLLLAWTTFPDTHGRLHNERSGEGPRQHGQSEIEAIISSHQVGTGKVKPEGYGPDGQERNAIKQIQSSAFENRLYLIARWIMRSGTCPVCGFAGDDDHIWQKWFQESWQESWDEQRFHAAHRLDLSIYVHENLLRVQKHVKEVKKLLTKPLAFFRSVDDRNHSGEVTQVEIEDSIRRGWAFFSTVKDKTEHLLPSQVKVAFFFGHFEFARETDVKLYLPTRYRKPRV